MVLLSRPADRIWCRDQKVLTGMNRIKLNRLCSIRLSVLFDRSTGITVCHKCWKHTNTCQPTMLYIFTLEILTWWLYQSHWLYSVSFYEWYVLTVFKADRLLDFVQLMISLFSPFLNQIAETWECVCSFQESMFSLEQCLSPSLR